MTSVGDLDAAAWDALEHGASPFLRWSFLRALEESGSVGGASGWAPRFLLAERAGELVGAAPAFLKGDSYGEYIFDWGWARASQQAGLPYYPKLVVAAPFTPATGTRLLVAAHAERSLIEEGLVSALLELARAERASSLHVLFCSEGESLRMGQLGLAKRASYQFHWHNHGYSSFDDFLAALKSRKRKQLRKERTRALEVIDSVDWVYGGELSAEDLEAIDRFYRHTVWAHGGLDYLRPGFFALLAQAMPEEMLFARARRRGETVAGALFFESASALYGRYWGAAEDLDFLHFEVAYYAGIERCIRRKVPLFEAGAQGEHKLLRGFEPSPTYSCHQMLHSEFDAAIRRFLRIERRQVEERMEAYAEYLPFRR